MFYTPLIYRNENHFRVSRDSRVNARATDGNARANHERFNNLCFRRKQCRYNRNQTLSLNIPIVFNAIPLHLKE